MTVSNTYGPLLDVAIVGGSLSGCMAAILLKADGHRVTVYERSRAGLTGRGGGVTTSQAVLAGLKAEGILDPDFPALPYDMLWLSKAGHGDGEDARFGRCPLALPLAMRCLHWSGMWEAMRRRVPDDRYVGGAVLADAHEKPNGVVLRFEDGGEARADLVAFADGYASQGRRIMFPDCALDYRGYLVWRGVVSESRIAFHPRLDTHPRISLRGEPGSFISYLIADRNGRCAAGERLLNWAVYLDLPEAELDEFMIDAAGVRRVGTIPAGAMRAEQEGRLKDRMCAALPDYFADIVTRSEDNQIQLIYTARPPAYRKGRMTLLGDAGAVVPPLTGSGLFKAFENARGLRDALAAPAAERNAALDRWSDEQMDHADAMLAMGEDMERAFIYDTIDLAEAAPEAVRAWFPKAVRVSPRFSYFDRDRLREVLA